MFDGYRRRAGLLFGIILGLIFALTSQIPDRLALPGIPIEQPPFSTIPNIVMIILIGSIVGLLTAWASTSIVSVLATSGIAAVFVAIVTMISGEPMIEARLFWMKLFAIFVLTPLIAAALILPIGLLRWLIDKQENLIREPIFTWERLWLPLLTIGLVAIIGFLSNNGTKARVLITRMNTLILDARTATSIEELPECLQPPDVDNFLTYGNSAYKLDWDQDRTNQYSIPRPAGNQGHESIVIARFDSGWMLVCLYANEAAPIPECRDFTPSE